MPIYRFLKICTFGIMICFANTKKLTKKRKVQEIKTSLRKNLSQQEEHMKHQTQNITCTVNLAQIVEYHRDGGHSYIPGIQSWDHVSASPVWLAAPAINSLNAANICIQN